MSDPAIARHLLPHERVVWSGRPATGIRIAGSDLLTIPLGLFCLIFSILWTNGARSSGAPVGFWLFGIPFVLVGLFMSAGRFPLDAWSRRNTRYAITERRVMIVRGAPFAKFTAIALNRLPALSLEERPSGLGTIKFGDEPASGWGRYDTQSLRSLMPSFHPTPAFHYIPNASRVFDRLQQVASQADTERAGTP